MSFELGKSNGHNNETIDELKYENTFVDNSEQEYNDFPTSSNIDIYERIEPDIDMQINDCLQLFEEKFWEELGADELHETMQELKDLIAGKLEIENIPELKYFYSDESRECGAYLGASNEIYLNLNHIDQPEDIAKTIIHETRHAWQSERMNLPSHEQNNFDKVLKSNDENYVEPQDNYLAYLMQPIELDAEQFTNDIYDQYQKSVEDWSEKDDT